MITFTIPGVPKGQGRPRFARMGKFVKTYDPKESRDWKQTVGAYAIAAGVKPIEGAVTLGVDCFMPRPQRLCRKKDTIAAVRCTSKPDWDNLGKLVADALIGIAYADDAQIWYGSCRKWYHEQGGMPRTEVTIEQSPT